MVSNGSTVEEVKVTSAAILLIVVFVSKEALMNSFRLGYSGAGKYCDEQILPIDLISCRRLIIMIMHIMKRMPSLRRWVMRDRGIRKNIIYFLQTQSILLQRHCAQPSQLLSCQ
jgi:hypothetical protein